MPENSKIITANITFRNMDATAALKNYASEKITNCLRKFARQDLEVSVVLQVEKKRQIAEVTFNYDGTNFIDSEESDDMYKSIDTLVDSLTSQLRRHKEKATKHH
jgi:putative sigma-54 modulation protein